jgi:hypothetical protein
MQCPSSSSVLEESFAANRPRRCSGDKSHRRDRSVQRLRGIGLHECESFEHGAPTLQEHLETFGHGYEDWVAGSTDVVPDVKAHRITVVRCDRFDDYTTTSYEV